MAISVGLELGDSVLRGVILEQHGSRIRLVASAQVPWSGEATEHLTAGLIQLRKTLPIQRPVIVGIPTSRAIVTTVQPLVATRKRAALAILFELQQHLPYDTAQAVWHYQWLNGLTPPRYAIVAATKRSLLEERLQCFQRAGVIIQAVGISAVAAVNSWLRQLEPTALPVAQAARAGTPSGILLNIDGPALEWIIVTASGLHVIPTFRTLEAQAQEPLTATLKASYRHVQELLAAKETGGGVWLLGQSASVPNLVEELKRELACPVELMDPSRFVMPGAASPPHLEQCVIPCGLALQGLRMARLPMNLLTNLQRQQRVTRARRLARSASWLCALLAVVFGASGMATILMHRQRLLQSLVTQEQTSQALRTEVRTLLQRQARLEHRLRQLEELAQGRALLVQAFSRIAEALPDEVWLTKLELSKDGALEGVLEGHSRSFQGVTQLMDRLKSVVGWTTVRPLATTVTTAPTSGEELVAFTVQIQHPLPALQRDPSSVPPARVEQGDRPDGSDRRAREAGKGTSQPGAARQRGARK